MEMELGIELELDNIREISSECTKFDMDQDSLTTQSVMRDKNLNKDNRDSSDDDDDEGTYKGKQLKYLDCVDPIIQLLRVHYYDISS